MSEWTITIKGSGVHGTGVSHDKKHETDADRMAADFVQKLTAAGHKVSSAKLTFGGEEDVTQGGTFVTAHQKAAEIDAPYFAKPEVSSRHPK